MSVVQTSARPLLLAALLLGCDAELYHALEERQVNEALVALREAGVAASKRPDGRARGQAPSFTLVVPKSEEIRALRLLAEEGLPRPRQRDPSTARGAGLLPLPEEAHDKRTQALEEQLAATLERLPQVNEARVHLVLPFIDPLRGDPPPGPGPEKVPRAQGAVLLRLRAGPPPADAEVAQLVARAVPGLSPSAVSVMRAQAPDGDRTTKKREELAPALSRVGPLLVAPSSERLANVLLALCLLLAAGLLVTLGWGRLRPRSGELAPPAK